MSSLEETWKCSCGAQGSADNASDADFDMDAHMFIEHGATKKTGRPGDPA